MEASNPTDWRLDAACRGMGPAIFYSTKLADVEQAARACSTCPVRTDCKATGETEEFGMWGGELRRPLAGRPRQPIVHGTIYGYRAHLRHNTPPCAECRAASTAHRRLRRTGELTRPTIGHVADGYQRDVDRLAALLDSIDSLDGEVA